MVAFDFDNTLIDTFSVMRRKFKENCNVDLLDYMNKCLYSSKPEIPGLSRWTYLDEIRKCLAMHYMEMKPEPYVIEYIPKFYEKYGKIKIITARQNFVKHQTNMWLFFMLPRYIEYDILFTKFKKEGLEGCRYLVEDRVDYLIPCLDDIEKGFLIKKPWNTGFKHEKVDMVDNIKDVYERIENYETTND